MMSVKGVSSSICFNGPARSGTAATAKGGGGGNRIQSQDGES